MKNRARIPTILRAGNFGLQEIYILVLKMNNYFYPNS